MTFRSLSNDQRKIGLGEALLRLFPKVRLIDSGETRLTFRDEKTGELFSLEGTSIEAQVLHLMYCYTGPSTPLGLLQAIPPEMGDLKDGKCNERSRRQGAILALRAYGLNPPGERELVEWLKHCP